jgi:SAM-dependent methyltransferase
LGEAIESVLVQTCQDFEIIVVDDGSTDATPEVVRQYPQARYLRQANRGLPAARNTGVAAGCGPYLVFLDADDRLLPEALSTGLNCFEGHADCAFVSGGHRRIDEAGTVIEQPTPSRVDHDHYLALLQGNYIGMHAAVMYQRSLLEAAGGFNERLPACEDYDLYLRLARSNPVRCHETVVAEYRTYGTSMSANTGIMLRTVLAVLRSQQPHLNQDARREAAFRAGLRYWKRLYVRQFLDQVPSIATGNNSVKVLWGAVAAARHAPGELWEQAYGRWVRPALPTSLPRLAARLRGKTYYPSVGKIRFGDLRRSQPISGWFGFDRGLPIDRYYIEQFLAAHADDIHGRVLEIGDSTYTRRFGGERVSRSDVLHIHEGHPAATFVGDLTNADHIPSNSFDCAIVTQTLHLIYDVGPALATLCRILKPGGVLLLTVPGISPISQDQWARFWYWSFTTLSVRRLLKEFFGPEDIALEAFGNVLAGCAFLQGVAAEELKPSDLEFHDRQYEIVIAARVTKPVQARNLQTVTAERAY